MRGNKIIGIVSRANLLRGLAAQPAMPAAIADDRKIKASVEKAMLEAGVRNSLLHIVVSGGVVSLWGLSRPLRRKMQRALPRKRHTV